MNILGIRADASGCGYYRVEQPLRTLKRTYGHNVYIDNIPAEAEEIDIVIFQRPGDGIRLQYLEDIDARRTPEHTVKIVFELDDDVWAIQNDNEAVWYYGQKEVQDNFTRSLQLVDACTVSTQPLADVLRSKGFKGEIYVLPNFVPDRLFKLFSERPLGLAHPSKGLTMLWSGSGTHLADVHLMIPGVTKYLRSNPDSSLIFLGFDYTAEFPSDVHLQLSFGGFGKSVAEYHSLLASVSQDVDVMLAPLSDNAFNASKSNLRLIEAGALGIPVIASNYGPYSLNPGGLHASDWEQELQLFEQAPLRKLHSALGRNWVEQNYLASSGAKVYEETYEAIINTPRSL